MTSTDRTPATPARAARPRPTRRLWLRGLLAAVAAVVVNLLVFVVARAAGVDFPVPDPASGDIEDLQPVFVVVSSVVGVLAATVGRWVHLRLLPLPEVVFPVGVVVLLLASFAQPFTVAPDMGLAGQLVLCLMHVVVGAAVLLGLGRRGTLVA